MACLKAIFDLQKGQHLRPFTTELDWACIALGPKYERWHINELFRMILLVNYKFETEILSSWRFINGKQLLFSHHRGQQMSILKTRFDT